jgi:hypothetical protein
MVVALMTSRPSRRTEARGVVLVVTGLLLCPVAHAEPSRSPEPTTAEPVAADARAKARELHTLGLTRFEAGDYGAAIDLFREAFALWPAPGLLYNLAQAERLGGACREALRDYQRFLDSHPDGEARDYAESYIYELAPCPDEVVAETSSTESVSPGARVSPTGPPPAPAPEPPRVSRRLVPKDHGRRRRIGAAVSFSAAAVLGGLAGYLAWRGDQASERVNQTFAHGGAWNAAEADAERRGRIANVGAVSALALALSAVACSSASEPSLDWLVGEWVFAEGRVLATCQGVRLSEPLKGIAAEIEAASPGQVLLELGPRCAVPLKANGSRATAENSPCNLGIQETLIVATLATLSLERATDSLAMHSTGTAQLVVPRDGLSEAGADTSIECERFELDGSLGREASEP